MCGAAMGDRHMARGAVRLAMHTTPRGTANHLMQAILSRYRTQQPLWPWVERVLHQMRPASLVRPVYHQTHVQFAPRLLLSVFTRWQSTVHRLARREEAHVHRQVFSNVGQALHTQQVFANIMLTPHTQQVVSHIVQGLHTQQIVHRLLTRGIQIEAVTTPGVPAVSRSSMSQAAAQAMDNSAPLFASVTPPGPLPRVVRRTAGVATAPEATSLVSGAQHAPSHDGFQETGGVQRGKELASIDINRLTEQVMHALDRRLIAQRERFGRS
jgi:hypothetical protein